jgi:hypothetical protein
VIGILVLMGWKASVDRRLDAGWRRSLGGASFLERYPATPDNATVRDLETLSAAIGIDMAPVETPGSVHPAPEAAKRFEPLKAFYAANRISTETSWQLNQAVARVFRKSAPQGHGHKAWGFNPRKRVTPTPSSPEGA